MNLVFNFIFRRMLVKIEKFNKKLSSFGNLRQFWSRNITRKWNLKFQPARNGIKRQFFSSPATKHTYACTQRKQKKQRRTFGKPRIQEGKAKSETQRNQNQEEKKGKRRIKIKICNFCLFCVLCIFYFCPLFCFLIPISVIKINLMKLK